MTTKAGNKISKGRILVVDDEADVRSLLKKSLESEGYTVEDAADGKLAQQILAFQSFDLVLSDVKMPNATGIQLLHYVKKESHTPIVLMTGFSDILENEEAIRLGVDGFLAKPFTRAQLLALLNQVLGAGKGDQKPDAEVSVDGDYGRIPIDDFITGRSLACDIYIRLSEFKYLKIGHKNEQVDLERLKQYKLKNVDFLYVKKDDFGDFVGFNIRVLKAASSSNKVPADTRIRLVRQTGELILENMVLQDINKTTLEQSQIFVQTATDAVLHSDRLASVLSALQGESNLLYMHCVAVSLFSVMIARQVGWSGANTLFKVSLAGLLHDIGLKEVPKEIRDRPRWELKQSEITMLEAHASRGAALLTRLPEIPGEIAQIVGQHHEEISGSGYPVGLTRNQIHPLARLIAVADRFCELAIQTAEGAPLPPKEAISRLLETTMGRLDPIYMTGLLNLFNVPIPREFANDQTVQSSQASLARRKAD